MFYVFGTFGCVRKRLTLFLLRKKYERLQRYNDVNANINAEIKANTINCSTANSKTMTNCDDIFLTEETPIFCIRRYKYKNCARLLHIIVFIGLMRQSEREIRRIEKSERLQEKIIEKKEAYMEKVSQKGDSDRLRKAEVEVNKAIAVLERIQADKTGAEVRDQIFAFVLDTQPVEISEIVKALNLPAESIEEHLKVLDVVKDEDGKLYSVKVKPAWLKLEAKLASLKGKISEIGHGLKTKTQKDQGGGVVIEKWKEIVAVNPKLTQEELKEIYIRLYPEEEADIERYLQKLKDDAKVEEGAKADVDAKTVDTRLSVETFLTVLKEYAKAEDERWIEPGMSFLVAISSVICYFCSHSAHFMALPPPSTGVGWYYWDIIRFDWYQSAFLSLLIFAILGGLLLIRYKKIGVPILILGAVLQFLSSPVYITCSQSSSFNWLSSPTLSLSILALMPLILASCLVLISIIAWIRKPLAKERVEELKRISSK